MTFELRFSKAALKDAKKVKQAGLKERVQRLLDILKVDPFQNSPPYEKLVGDLAGKFSRRLNLQHRLVYQVETDARIVRILRMWTHYE